MKKLLLCLTAFILSGCAAEPITTESAVTQAISSVSDTTIISTTLETTVTETATDTQTARNTTTATTEVIVSVTTTETSTKTSLSTAEEPNPGMEAARYVVINSEHYYPFPSSSLMLELDDGFYDYWNSGVPVKRYRDCVRRNVCLDDIVNNYEPIGTAVYTEKPENEFETNLKEYGGADIYFFSEGYTFDFLGNGGNEICALLIAAEPAYIVDGQEFYQYVEVDYNQYENNH